MFNFQKKIEIQSEPELEQLEQLLPFKTMDQEDLFLLSKKATLIEVKKGTLLFKEGSTDDWSYFLVSGELNLKDSDGVHKILAAGTDEALIPVSQLQPRIYTVSALSDISYIKMDKSLLDNIRPEKEESHENILKDGIIKKATYHNNALYKQVHKDLMYNTLKFPIFNQISTQLTKLLQSENTDVEFISNIIQQHPVLTAKLIKAANGPLFYGKKPVDTCKDAITRMGIVPAKSMSLGVLLNEELQFKLKDPELQQRADNVRTHCTEVAAISSVIARLVEGFTPEKAMLAGLIHDIGVFPILYYAEQHPELINGLEHIDETIRQLSGDLGAYLLEKYNFSEEMISAAREADIWQRDEKATADYCDIVLLAQAYSFVGKEEAKSMPKLQEIPALKKLKLDQLTPQLSMKLLDYAKKEINKTKALLGTVELSSIE